MAYTILTNVKIFQFPHSTCRIIGQHALCGKENLIGREYKRKIMKHDVNLNIHYTAPDEIWKKIGDVYRSMPYWAGTEHGPKWIGENIDLWASVEPGGVQIAGTMPEDIWETWYDELKTKLSAALGYEIGQLEDGFDFKYWT